MKKYEQHNEKIWTGNITVCPGYQRQVDMARVNRIVKDFNPNLVNPPKVSERGGKYYCFDGWHTVQALKQYNGGKDLRIMCRVFRGMTEQDEADLFIQQNGHSARVRTADKLKARLNYHDPTVEGMVRDTNECGLEVSFNNNSKPYSIVAVASLYSLYTKMSRQDFQTTLKIIRSAWDGERDSLSEPILRGVGLFVKAYAEKYDEKSLVSKLRKVPASQILREGKGMGGKRAGEQFARVILRIYNRGRARKLEDLL